MSDVQEVAVVRDNGHRERWGLGTFALYRKDGKKLTLVGKRILILVGSLFTISSGFVLVRGPTEMELKSPIVFNGIVSPVSTVEVPPAADENDVRRQRSNMTVNSVPRKYSGLQVVSRPQLGKIPPGSIAKAVLVSGASNGIAKAKLTETLSFNGEGLAEEGTILVGTGSSSEERLNIEFSKMIFRDGSVQEVRAQACDFEDQTVGLKGSKVSKYASLLAASAGLNLVGGLAEGLQDNEVQNGVAVKKTDLKNAALNGAAKASLETSKEIAEKWKQSKSVIEVKAGTQICIIFSGD